MKTFSVSADRGCIAIKSGGLTAYFGNGYGDGYHRCLVDEKGTAITRKFKFVESFEVETEAYLLDYDCGGNEIYTFGPGHWFVHCKDGDTLIQRLSD